MFSEVNPLSKLLTMLPPAVKTSVQNCCDTICSHSCTNQMWILKKCGKSDPSNVEASNTKRSGERSLLLSISEYYFIKTLTFRYLWWIVC